MIAGCNAFCSLHVPGVSVGCGCRRPRWLVRVRHQLRCVHTVPRWSVQRWTRCDGVLQLPHWELQHRW